MGESPAASLKRGVWPALAAACPAPETGPYPLSIAQESLWFVEQMIPASPVYNLPEAWRLAGPLDLEALQRSLDQVVRRHEVLRTRILAQAGRPEQRILGSATMDVELVDLSGAKDPDAALRQPLHAEAQRPFDLSRAPLGRVVVFRHGAREHTLLLNLHHLVADAWSQRVLLQELALGYGAAVQGTVCSLPALPIQYADFALWQRDLPASEAGRQDLAYWQAKLRQPCPKLLLPADYPRRAVRSYQGQTQFVEIGKALADGLRELSRQAGATLFMTLLAGFNALLHRHTGQEDIIVGSPMAGRDRLEIQGLIGLCVNTHALRTDLSGRPSFRELLGRVREVVLGAYTHQELPAEAVLQTLHSHRPAGAHPLFELVFGWQGASLEPLELPGLEPTRIELDTGTAKFEWTLLASERPDGSVQLRSEHSTEVFAPQTVAHWLRQFLNLLASAVAGPDRPIWELDLMTEADRHELLVGGNQTGAHYEQAACIHQVFEARAQENPQDVALSVAGRDMTYGVLNARANQLARYLQERGVVDGTKVALGLERSGEMLVGLLAILKAGGAYVPLDRAYPPERLRAMLEDSGCAVLVTDSSWCASQPVLAAASTVICLDREPDRLAAQSQANLRTTTNPAAPAYVMYTSGSTGRPKGVLVPHRAVIRLVRNTNYLHFCRELVFLQLAPVSFDASTFEIWGALLNGARLIVYPPGVPSLEELGRAVHQSRVTTLWLTSGLFQQMVDHQLHHLRGLKHLLAGGDVLSPAHVAKASRELEGCQLINGYGPTENTTFTCCYRVPANWPEGQTVPIGRPISNTRVYVLDERRQPVPIGVPGELYTSGDGLADGYLNQPELTAERFVPNPFEPGKAARMYRTGDVVRWRTDGNLEFVARTDGQVKIRGYRVEPAEVEAALAGHPAAQAVAVTARPDHSGTRQLVAYVVPRPGQTVVEEELRKFLAGKLPPYLVPSRLVSLASLPLSANGKVDRNALPEPAPGTAPAGPPPRTLPQSPLQQTLCAIWGEVLGRPGVGVHDDFFQLGGHSLLAMQVIARVSRSCQVELPVVAIFEAPTIARLAGLIEQARQAQPAIPAAAIPRSAPEPAAELLGRLNEFSEAELDDLLREPELNK